MLLLNILAINFMDFIDILRRALKFTWENKSLWVLGFIMALFTGTSSSNIASNYRNYANQNSYDSSSYNNSATIESINRFFQQPGVILIIILALIVFLIISLIGWYLVSIARGGLTHAVISSQKVKLNQAWKFGVTNAVRYIVLDLVKLPFLIITMLPLVIFIIIIILLAAASTAAPILFILICGVAIILVIYMLITSIIWAMVSSNADRVLIIKNTTALETLKISLSLSKKYWDKYLMGWLLSIIPNCAWAIIMFFVTLVGVIPAILIIITAAYAGPIVLIFTVLIVLVLFSLVMAVINAPYIMFNYTYWTMIIAELLGQPTIQN